MKLTLANVKALKQNSDNALTKRVCSYVSSTYPISKKNGVTTKTT